MMLYRKNDATLDFDLAKVIEQSRDNPVFYVSTGMPAANRSFATRASVVDLRTIGRRRAHAPSPKPLSNSSMIQPNSR